MTMLIRMFMLSELQTGAHSAAIGVHMKLLLL